MTGVIRVVLADDQRAVREGLAILVGLLDGIEVVATAADGREAVDAALTHRPDVILMDLRMPELDGAAATRRLAEELPETRVVILTTYADDESLFPALEAGARGYLTKDAGSEEIEAAIRAVHGGHTHLDPSVQQRLLSAALTGPPRKGRRDEPPDGLTPREAEVLVLIAEGLSNREIEQRLYLSKATVKTHINRIFFKTGVRDRAQAVSYAYRMGLVDTPRGELP
jgi:DNA-binding NarL/FixJ family response regulator